MYSLFLLLSYMSAVLSGSSQQPHLFNMVLYPRPNFLGQDEYQAYPSEILKG